MDFTNKSVIVTGASVGMGREIAAQFAARGAQVVVNYTKAENEAAKTLDIIKKAGGAAVIKQADVSNEKEADDLVATAVKEFGKVDILVNNAGITSFIPFNDLEAQNPDVWNKLYAVNVLGPFFCARAASRVMLKAGSGVIINNATVSGTRPSGSSIPYCTSKAALLHMSSCLAVSLAPTIRVNCVSPGMIGDTRWNADVSNFNPEKYEELAFATSLLQRSGKAKDIAAAVLFLASDEASFITGVDLRVDGGRFFKI